MEELRSAYQLLSYAQPMLGCSDVFQSGAIPSICGVYTISTYVTLAVLLLWIICDLYSAFPFKNQCNSFFRRMFCHVARWPPLSELIISPPNEHSEESGSKKFWNESLTKQPTLSPFKFHTMECLIGISLADTVNSLRFVVVKSTASDMTLFWYSLSCTLIWSYAGISFYVNNLRCRYLLLLVSFLDVLVQIIIIDVKLFPNLKHTTLEDHDLYAFSYLHIRPFASLVIVLMALSLPFSRRKISPYTSSTNEVPSWDKQTPEDYLSIYEWLSFSWVYPLIKLARNHPDGQLQPENVWSISPTAMHSNLLRAFNRIGDSILYKLINTVSQDMIIDIIVDVSQSSLDFLTTYFFKNILEKIEDGSATAKFSAYNMSIMSFALSIFLAQILQIKAWHSRRAYERVRGLLMSLVYEKALKRKQFNDMKLDKSGERKHVSRNVVTFLHTDSYLLSEPFKGGHTWMFSKPIEMTIAIIFLYSVIGWSCFVGIAIGALTIPLDQMAGLRVKKNMAEVLRAKDKKVDTISEFFSSIRVLKAFAWEKYWVKTAKEARQKELDWQFKENISQCLMNIIWSLVPVLATLTMLLSYTKLAKQELTIPVAFTCLNLLSRVSNIVNSLPSQLISIRHTMISAERMDNYLNGPERPELSLRNDVKISSTEVGYEEGTFRWSISQNDLATTDNLSNEFELRVPSFKFCQGELNIITGPMGSGKSAILYSLLGEMESLSGKIIRPVSKSSFSYASQIPWLERGSIKDNILFRSKYDKERLKQVIFACALNQDIEKFPNGVYTEIGEKGVSLSGGQKARVALARAMYSKSTVVLLDDPLSSVDTSTARHLIQNCLTGPIASGRTIILVTHHEGLVLPKASMRVGVNSGNVTVDFLQKTSADTLKEKLDMSSTQGHVNEAIFEPPSFPVRKLIKDEKRAKGSVEWKVYNSYIQAAGSIIFLSLISLTIFDKFFDQARWWYFKSWGESYNTMSIKNMREALHLPPANENVDPWLLGLFIISVVGIILGTIKTITSMYSSIRIAKIMFNKCLDRVSRAPVSFYDQNPVGRLLNRFTADVDAIDGRITSDLIGMVSILLRCLITFTILVVVAPPFIPFALLIIYAVYSLMVPFIICCRELRRLEFTMHSPVFSFGEQIRESLSTVRAFALEKHFLADFLCRVDEFQNFDHHYWNVNFWMSLRSDYLGATTLFIINIIALYFDLSSGLAAFAILNAQTFVTNVHSAFDQYGNLQLNLGSMERVHEFLNVEQEAQEIIENNRPPAYWPSDNNGMQVEKLVVRYAVDLDPVIKGMTFDLKGNEKIGVVGRTGSGKSTCALSLLRIIEPDSGSIRMDDVDVCSIGLEDLRSRVSYVPQDGILLSGTLRSNLDPFGEHSDIELHHSLAMVGLQELNEDGLLDSEISAGGSNMSSGRRQMISLARALLRDRQIIILDEATSAIDFDNDIKIQETLRKELSGKLVICIAHRIRTVIDYDRIMVVDNGEIVEMDTPARLLNKQDGFFRSMCEASGDWDDLQSIVQRKGAKS